MDFLLVGVIVEITLRYAHSDDVQTLKNLWQICFGDRMRYIDVFFERMFNAENTVVSEVDGKLAGVVYLLERKLNDRKFLYGYAIGVFPEYRGNGICEKMLEFVKVKAEKKGCIFGLHPANDKLTEFYKRIGLNEMYYLKEVEVSNSDSDVVLELQSINAEDFYMMRKKAFSNNVEWDESALRYILENGESVKKISLQNRDVYFVISRCKGYTLIKETNASDEEVVLLNNSIRRHCNSDKVVYLLQSESALPGVLKPEILGFSQKDYTVYMNLFLD